MTRDEARDIIISALGSSTTVPDRSLAEATQLAIDIAAALDALGLLKSAATQLTAEETRAQAIAGAARIVTGNPLPLHQHSRTNPPEHGSLSPPPADADPSLNTPPPAEGGGPEYWAAKRQRP